MEHDKEAAEREIIDANVLELMAKERPNECFLKGSGVLKLIGAIRQLEAEIRALTASEATAGIPEGWKLVPAEPTEEMHVAAVQNITRCTGNDDFPPRVWRAMIAAAPSTPAQPFDALRKVGAQMANVMFNLAQKAGHTLDSDDCTLFDRLRKEWDSARNAAPSAPSVPLKQDPETIADLKGYIEYLQGRDRALGLELNMRRQNEIGEVWYWQHDGGNHVESLTCPIVIPAAEFRALTQAAPSVPDEKERIKAMNIEGMAECMRMFRADMIEAGVIGDSVPPMFMTEAILGYIGKLRAQQAAPSVPIDRNAVLEEAAKLLDDRAADAEKHLFNDEAYEARECADAIRALKSQQAPTVQQERVEVAGVDYGDGWLARGMAAASKDKATATDAAEQEMKK